MSTIERRRVVVGILLAVSMTTTACAGTGDEAMVDDADLTKRDAIEQTLEYLERTEAALPAGIALAANSDAPDAVDPAVPNSNSMPCNSSDGADLATEPKYVYMDYFVTGVPDGQSAKYLKQIRELWESWGWSPVAKPDERLALYANEDGYILKVRQYPETGSFSVGGQTPCIAADKFTGSDEVPQQIGGPSS